MNSLATEQREHEKSSALSGFLFRVARIIALAVMTAGSASLGQAQQGTLKPYAIDNTRDMRFCEILVVKPSGVEIYNTTGMDDCPAQLWNALDTEKLKTELGALKVEKNGPRFWMMDSQTVAFGDTASFGGVNAQWLATLQLA